jgi:hypothetical protein
VADQVLPGHHDKAPPLEEAPGQLAGLRIEPRDPLLAGRRFYRLVELRGNPVPGGLRGAEEVIDVPVGLKIDESHRAVPLIGRNENQPAITRPHLGRLGGPALLGCPRPHLLSGVIRDGHLPDRTVEHLGQGGRIARVVDADRDFRGASLATGRASTVRGMVITSATRDFLVALVGAAASLTGLLFVAISVAPRDGTDGGPVLIRQIRAAAALLSFVNCLAVALFGLQPGISIRWPAVVLGVTGIFFVAAATRSILSSPTTMAQRRSQLSLLNLLLLIFGTEFACGIILLANSRNQTAVDVLSSALISSLLLGIARAWELVGDRSVGIFTSIGVLTQRAPDPLTPTSNPAADDDDSRGAGEAGSPR